MVDAPLSPGPVVGARPRPRRPAGPHHIGLRL